MKGRDVPGILGSLMIEGRLISKMRATIVVSVLLILMLGYAHYSTATKAISESLTIEVNLVASLGEDEYLRMVQEGGSNPGFVEAIKGVKPVTGPNHALSFLGALAPLLFAAWGALIVGNEFVWRTAKLRAVHSGWTDTVINKMVVIVLAGAAVAVAGALLGWVGGLAAWGAIVGQTITPELITGIPIVPPLWHQILVISIGLAFYGLLGGFIALALRSPVVGAISGFAVPYIEATLVQSMPVWWLPHSAFGELMAAAFVYSGYSAVMVFPNPAFEDFHALFHWAVMGGWILLVSVSMIILSRRQQIT